jgi:hypothetical protein
MFLIEYSGMLFQWSSVRDLDDDEVCKSELFQDCQSNIGKVLKIQLRKHVGERRYLVSTKF